MNLGGCILVGISSLQLGVECIMNNLICFDVQHMFARLL